jgi:RNA polymerase sigma-70 factor (ECF subfamily)
VSGDHQVDLADRDDLRRTAAGDACAFERFVERHEASISRFLTNVLDDPAAAEDALQETFLAAWRAARRFRGESSVRTWVFAIARNAASRHYRRRDRVAEEATLDELGVLAGWGADDEAGVRRVADRQLVAIGFRGLGPEEREVLVLRDFEGFSGQECADMLGLSLPALKSRLHRARLRFVGNLRREMRYGA